MSFKFCSMNSSALMGLVEDHTFLPPLQSRSMSPHLDAAMGSKGPVALHVIMPLERCMSYVCGKVGLTLPGTTCCAAAGARASARKSAAAMLSALAGKVVYTEVVYTE